MTALGKLLVCAAVVGLAGCSSAPAKPTTFTMAGKVVLPIRGSIPDGASSCTGYQGSSFRNVSEGATVTVFGSDGVRLGQGVLGLGVPHDEGNQSITCTFAVSIASVPVAAGPYQLRVADLDPQKVSVAQAQAGFTVSFE